MTARRNASPAPELEKDQQPGSHHVNSPLALTAISRLSRSEGDIVRGGRRNRTSLTTSTNSPSQAR